MKRAYNLPVLDQAGVAELLSIADADVSYVSNANFMGVRTTAHIPKPGRWSSKRFASDVMAEVRKAELDAMYPPRQRETVRPGKRTEPYTGPFPRGKHSHRCANCNDGRAVACYKTQCTRPQLTDTCGWCRPSGRS